MESFSVFQGIGHDSCSVKFGVGMHVFLLSDQAAYCICMGFVVLNSNSCTACQNVFDCICAAFLTDIFQLLIITVLRIRFIFL